MILLYNNTVILCILKRVSQDIFFCGAGNLEFVAGNPGNVEFA